MSIDLHSEKPRFSVEFVDTYSIHSFPPPSRRTQQIQGFQRSGAGVSPSIRRHIIRPAKVSMRHLWNCPYRITCSVFSLSSSIRIRFIRSHRPHAAPNKYRGFREVVLVCVLRFKDIESVTNLEMLSI